MKLSEEICDYSDLPKSQCDHCKPTPAKVVVPESDKPMLADTVVIARENSKCPLCEERIIANVDHIAKIMEGDYSGAWAHYGCGR
jgi:hypothetical protein